MAMAGYRADFIGFTVEKLAFTTWGRLRSQLSKFSEKNDKVKSRASIRAFIGEELEWAANGSYPSVGYTTISSLSNLNSSLSEPSPLSTPYVTDMNTMYSIRISNVGHTLMARNILSTTVPIRHTSTDA